MRMGAQLAGKPLTSAGVSSTGSPLPSVCARVSLLPNCPSCAAPNVSTFLLSVNTTLWYPSRKCLRLLAAVDVYARGCHHFVKGTPLSQCRYASVACVASLEHADAPCVEAPHRRGDEVV